MGLREQLSPCCGHCPPIPCTQKLFLNTPGSQCYRRGSGQIWIQLEDTCLIGNTWSWKRTSLHVASWTNHQIIFQFKDSPWFLSSALSWKPNNKELASLARSARLFGKQFNVAPCSEDRSFQTMSILNLSRLYSSMLFLSSSLFVCFVFLEGGHWNSGFLTFWWAGCLAPNWCCVYARPSGFGYARLNQITQCSKSGLCQEEELHFYAFEYTHEGSYIHRNHLHFPKIHMWKSQNTTQMNLRGSPSQQSVRSLPQHRLCWNSGEPRACRS